MANNKSTKKNTNNNKKTTANKKTSSSANKSINKNTSNRTKATTNKKNNEIINDNTEAGMEVTKLLYIVIAIVVIIVLFYLLTYFINKSKKEELQVTPASIQYSEIIVGELLNRSETEYYVLATLEDDPYMNTYNYYLENLDNIKIYTINLNDMFNKNYISEGSNLNISNLSDIRFKESTLIKVSNNKIDKYYEGNENIVNELKNM